MLRRRDPLVPPSLFRSRTFSAINLSTFLIYAALYVLLYLQNLFLQGVLGYSPLAAAIVSLPSGLALALLSAWAGTLAGRIGARRFLVGGPLLMLAGSLWWLRIPASSTPWLARLDDAASLVPPIAALTDPLPATLLFGLGISLVVAPLTSTLMSSVPVERAGLASALNNALSRVGQPLASAAIFILITDRFYASLAVARPGPGSRIRRAAQRRPAAECPGRQRRSGDRRGRAARLDGGVRPGDSRRGGTPARRRPRELDRAQAGEADCARNGRARVA